jgi:hypothetical protein
MFDGPYVFRIKESEISYILVTIIYQKGKIIYHNKQIVDKPSNLSEEFKEKLKEHQ